MERSVGPDRMLRRLVGRGLEIGAFQGPQLLPEGDVTYVDVLTRAEALRYFPEVPRAVPAVEPDVLAPADDMPMIADGSQDFVIASHLLEHTEDPIAALLEWRRVLAPEGLLYLCLPDKRGTFDRPRPRTTLRHLVDDHAAGEERRAARDLEHYLEWARVINGLDDPGQAAWWADFLQRLRFPIHFHCWIPDDVKELLDHLREAHGCGFTILDDASMRDGYEFALLLAAEARPA